MLIVTIRRASAIIAAAAVAVGATVADVVQTSLNILIIIPQTEPDSMEYRPTEAQQKYHQWQPNY